MIGARVVEASVGASIGMLLGSNDASDDGMLLGSGDASDDGMLLGSNVDVVVTHAATSLVPPVVVAEVVVVVQSRVTVADESYALLNFSPWVTKVSVM